MTHPDRFRETELGDLFCDIVAERLGIDVMLLASGSIRGEELGPVVQYRNLTECFPYDGKVNMLTVTGRQLRSMLKFMLRDEVWQGGGSGFFQISKRLRVSYNVPSTEITSLTFDGKPVTDEALYKIGLQQFQYSSFEKYFNLPINEIEDNHPTRTIATSVRDIVEEYISAEQNIDDVLDGRITITGKE